jgi:hypothetical protein
LHWLFFDNRLASAARPSAARTSETTNKTAIHPSPHGNGLRVMNLVESFADFVDALFVLNGNMLKWQN